MTPDAPTEPPGRSPDDQPEEHVDRLVQEKWESVRAYVRLRWRRDLARKASPTDIVQSACRRALQAASRVRLAGPRAAFAWLRTIADNTMRDKHRALTTGRRDVDQELRLGGDEDLVAGAPGTSPLDQAEAEEQQARLHAAIAALPEDQRRVIELRVLEGLTRPVIAERLGKSADAVDALLRRGRLRLSRELGEGTGDTSGGA